MTIVVNIKRAECEVPIHRGTIWGNPFIIGLDGDRATVNVKYENWLRRQPHLLVRLPQLRGKALGCFCAPKACHGHVLARLADERTAS